MEKIYQLPIGYRHNDQVITEMDVARTNGETEKIFVEKVGQSKIYTWFGKLIAATVVAIGGDPIAAPFLKQEDKSNLPEAILNMPMLDAASILLQVQRLCWQDKLAKQHIRCRNCGENLITEVDLNRVPVPKSSGENMDEYVVKLDQTYEITDMPNSMKQYEGYQYNHLVFRTATLGDAILHQELNKDQLLFWRKVAIDTILGGFYKEDDKEDTPKQEVPDNFFRTRSMAIFNRDLETKTMKLIRDKMQSTQPSVKMYYEEDCPKCGEPTPFYASMGSFFTT